MPIIVQKDSQLIPPPDDCSLWRFMSITKFLALISSGSVAFTQVQQLIERDPKEGSYTTPALEYAARVDQDDELAQKLAAERGIGGAAGLRTARTAHGTNLLNQLIEFGRKTQYVSCWNMSNFEPAHLWAMYASESDGIAIKTNLASMKNSFLQNTGSILIGEMEYCDFATPEEFPQNVLKTIYRKRIEFTHEKEVRLQTRYNTSGDSQARDEVSKGIALEKLPAYVPMKCDIHSLISEIIIAPFAPEWAFAAIKSIAEKYELTCPIERSTLAT